jgi:hypothetical protein
MCVSSVGDEEPPAGKDKVLYWREIIAQGAPVGVSDSQLQ